MRAPAGGEFRRWIVKSVVASAKRKTSPARLAVEEAVETGALPGFHLLTDEEQKHAMEVLRRRVDVERRLVDLANADRNASSLENFVKEGWGSVYGKRDLQWNWHLSKGCELLQAMRDGEIMRIIMNWPPRTLKSNIVGVFLPPFVWTEAPEDQFITTSYKKPLAERDSKRSKKLMLTKWYLDQWGHKFYFPQGQNASDRYTNSQGGHRITLGMLTGNVGEDCDWLVIDDGNNPMKVVSEQQREKTNETVEDLLLRLNDPKTGRVINMQQRVHEMDITGYLLENFPTGEWVHQCFPLEFERDHPTPSPRYDIRRKDGELLFPARLSRTWTEKMRTRMNAYLFAGRFQQRPSLKGGNIFMRDWWQIWTETDMPAFEIYIISIDTAYEEGQENDYSACTVWGLWKPNAKSKFYNIMLADAWRERKRYGDIKAKVLATIKKYTIDDVPPDHVIIERKGAGTTLLQDFADAGIDAISYNPGRDSKIMRANVVSDVLADGVVWVPGKPLAKGGRSDKLLTSWAEPVVKEAERFPKDDHDDWVDTFTQMLHFCGDTGYVENSLDLPIEEPDPQSQGKHRDEAVYG